MIALQALTPEGLVARSPGLKLEEARRIVSTIHRGMGLEGPLQGVRRVALSAVREAVSIPELELRAEVRSGLDPFRKYVLADRAGTVFETVRIPLEVKGRFSACVSSQVGCGLACSFCATARLGLARNLEAWEIVEQVRVVRGMLSPGSGERIHGVVFQGMGEPLANLDNVLAAIEVLTNPCALAIDARNITVSTVGLPLGIRRLADTAPKVRLAWSIGSARCETRRELMPIARVHLLSEVLDAVAYHARTSRRAPMWTFTPLAGINDGDEDAFALARAFHEFVRQTGVRPRLSVVPYNSIDVGAGDPFERASDEKERRFRDRLREFGVGTHRRYSGGADVAAGCGQLAALV